MKTRLKKSQNNQVINDDLRNNDDNRIIESNKKHKNNTKSPSPKERNEKESVKVNNTNSSNINDISRGSNIEKSNKNKEKNKKVTFSDEVYLRDYYNVKSLNDNQQQDALSLDKKVSKKSASTMSLGKNYSDRQEKLFLPPNPINNLSKTNSNISGFKKENFLAPVNFTDKYVVNPPNMFDNYPNNTFNQFYPEYVNNNISNSSCFNINTQALNIKNSKQNDKEKNTNNNLSLNNLKPIGSRTLTEIIKGIDQRSNVKKKEASTDMRKESLITDATFKTNSESLLNKKRDRSILLKTRAVLDENGELIIQRPDYSQVNERLQIENSCVPIEERKEKITSMSFRRKSDTKKWSAFDTLLFYKCVEVFGTDFSLHELVFRGRSRNQIKNKFIKEQKNNLKALQSSLSKFNKEKLRKIVPLLIEQQSRKRAHDVKEENDKQSVSLLDKLLKNIQEKEGVHTRSSLENVKKEVKVDLEDLDKKTNLNNLSKLKRKSSISKEEKSENEVKVELNTNNNKKKDEDFSNISDSGYQLLKDEDTNKMIKILLDNHPLVIDKECFYPRSSKSKGNSKSKDLEKEVKFELAALTGITGDKEDEEPISHINYTNNNLSNSNSNLSYSIKNKSNNCNLVRKSSEVSRKSIDDYADMVKVTSNKSKDDNNFAKIEFEPSNCKSNLIENRETKGVKTRKASNTFALNNNLNPPLLRRRSSVVKAESHKTLLEDFLREFQK